MTDDTLRAALIHALAEIEQIDRPNTEPGGWWDKRIEPLVRALAASATDEPCSIEPAFSQHEYAVDYCETHDRPASYCARPAAPATDEDAPSDQIDEAWMVVKQAVVRYGDERGREGFRAAVAEERAARPAAPVALDVKRLADVLARRFPGNDDFSDAAEYVAREYRALAASAPDEGPLPGQEVGHGCSPECNACRADRLAASAPDEGPLPAGHPDTWPGGTMHMPARPAAAPALDVERLAEALDADWSAAWREVPVIGPNGVEFIEARWDKRALAEIVARKYAALSPKEPTDD